MKKQFYFIIALAILCSGCARKQIRKMVETGNYDSAIDRLTHKLAGKKKKDEYVLLLEEAFNKANAKDLSKIEELKSKDRPELSDRIYYLYEGLLTRQDKVYPLLPLESETGYIANMTIESYNSEMRDQAQIAAKVHYQRALSLLQKAKKGDKTAARSAFRSLDQIGKYFGNYEDRHDLMQLADSLGQTRVLLDVSLDELGYLSKNLEVEMYDLTRLIADGRWTEYYLEFPDDLEIDVRASLRFYDLWISPERETSDREHFKKEIQDGVKKEIVTETVKDTTGKWIKVEVEKEVPNMIEVKAHVDIVRRTKDARLHGLIEWIDLNNGDLLFDEETKAIVDFEGEQITFHGDKRALPQDVKSDLDSQLEFFPTDYEMITTASLEIKRKFVRKLEKEFP